MTYHDIFADLSLWIWTEAINHLWQSTVFLLLIILIAIVLRKADAKSRCIVWLIASAKFVLPLSLFTALGNSLNLSSLFLQPSPSLAESFAGSGVVSLVSIVSLVPTTFPRNETTDSHPEIYCGLTLIWLLGCLSLFILWGRRSRSLRERLRYQNTPTTEREAEVLNNARVRMGLAPRVNLVSSENISEPVVLGVWKPVVIMPKGLSQKLTDDELESVFMHELTHIRRRDNFVGVLQMALCCLLWFHPLVWFIRRKLIEERERACDEAVVARGNKPQIYAAGLLKVVQYGLYSHQSAGVASATGANLTNRLESIMNNKDGMTSTRWQKGIVVLAFVGFVFTCLLGFGLARSGNASTTSGKSTASDEHGKLYLDVYIGGKFYDTMEMDPPEPNKAVVQGFVYPLPTEAKVQTEEAERIYGIQTIPKLENDSVKIEILALLEDLRKMSNAHPLHEFKKRPIASYNVRPGGSAVVFEMSKLGIAPLELNVCQSVMENPADENREHASRTATAMVLDKNDKVVSKEVIEITAQCTTKAGG